MPATRPPNLTRRAWNELQTELREIKTFHTEHQATTKRPEFFPPNAWQALQNKLCEISLRHAYDRALLAAGEHAARHSDIRMAQSREIPSILNWVELPVPEEPQDNERKSIFIYLIYCIATNQYYVGQTITGINRWKQHSANLRAEKHTSALMQHVWNRHADSFVARIVEYIPTAHELSNRERYWIVRLEAVTHGFNNGSSKTIFPRLRPRDYVSPLLTQIAAHLI